MLYAVLYVLQSVYCCLVTIEFSRHHLSLINVCFQILHIWYIQPGHVLDSCWSSPRHHCGRLFDLGFIIMGNRFCIYVWAPSEYQKGVLGLLLESQLQAFSRGFLAQLIVTLKFRLLPDCLTVLILLGCSGLVLYKCLIIPASSNMSMFLNFCVCKEAELSVGKIKLRQGGPLGRLERLIQQMPQQRIGAK